MRYSITKIYDGVHYDALVLSFDPKEEWADVTIFSTADNETKEMMSAYVQEQSRARKFTDLTGFDLKCLVCGQGLKGQAGALSHASTTGHANFAQIR